MGAEIAFVDSHISHGVAESRAAKQKVQCRFYLEVGVAQSGWAAIAGANRFAVTSNYSV